MELSKKVGYIKGLMAGLKIDDTTPVGQVLCAMSDLLEEMAEEVEINAEIIDNVTAYIDEVEDQCDCLDDIYAEEYDEDPCECEEEECEEEECGCGCGEEADEPEAETELPQEEIPETPLAEEPSEPAEQPAPEPEIPFASEEPVPSVFEQNNIPTEVPFTPPQPEPIQYECCCPICGRTFGITQTELDKGSANCPGCGELLEFE